MITLGQEGKDKVTGFKGIIISRSQWLTGCDQYLLSPKVKKDGEIKEACWFDEGRINIIGKGIDKEKVIGKKKGGPQMYSPKAH